MNTTANRHFRCVHTGPLRQQTSFLRRDTVTGTMTHFVRSAALVVLFLLAIALNPTPIHAQEDDPELFSAAEVCQQVNHVLPGLDDRERQIGVRIAQLEEDFDGLEVLAQRYQEYVNPNLTSAESNYANAMFWLAMLRLQGLKNEINQLKATLAQIEFDRAIFGEIAAAFACEQEEEEESAQTARLQTSCNVRTGSVINWAKLNQLTFVAVEDPNPAQDDIRWIEFRVALTNDPGQPNPTLWLERAIAWAEEKKTEGWVELTRGNVTGFCNAIGAACITPPAGISPRTFERLCGGD